MAKEKLTKSELKSMLENKFVTDYLLEEFRFLINLRKSGVEQVNQFTNFYILIVSGLIAILSINISWSQESVFMIVLVSIIILIGVLTYTKVISLHISITNNTRKINGMRKKVLNNFIYLEKFIEMQTDPKEPKYNVIGYQKKPLILAGYSGIICIIVSACVGFLFYYLRTFYFNCLEYFCSVLISFLLFVASYFIFYFCTKSYLSKLEDKVLK